MTDARRRNLISGASATGSFLIGFSWLVAVLGLIAAIAGGYNATHLTSGVSGVNVTYTVPNAPWHFFVTLVTIFGAACVAAALLAFAGYLLKLNAVMVEDSGLAVELNKKVFEQGIPSVTEASAMKQREANEANERRVAEKEKLAQQLKVDRERRLASDAALAERNRKEQEAKKLRDSGQVRIHCPSCGNEEILDGTSGDFQCALCQQSFSCMGCKKCSVTYLIVKGETDPKCRICQTSLKGGYQLLTL